jgi:RNA polymerase sigma-70 factor, ECF subfamily
VDAGLLETEAPAPATTAERWSVGTDLDQAACVFVNVRPRLVEIAYRILGSGSETDDVVQEAWLRWQRTDRSVVRNPTAFLATTTARLALNVAQSARSRHETYAESWLLDQANPTIGPEARAERGEEIEHAALLLLRNLTPAERAAFVLREAFDYPYKQIGAALCLTTAHARQLVRRAHKHVVADRGRPVNASVHRRLVRALRSAARVGNLIDLEQLLAADVVNRSSSTAAEAQARSGVSATASTAPQPRTSRAVIRSRTPGAEGTVSSCRVGSRNYDRAGRRSVTTDGRAVTSR